MLLYWAFYRDCKVVLFNFTRSMEQLSLLFIFGNVLRHFYHAVSRQRWQLISARKMKLLGRDHLGRCMYGFGVILASPNLYLVPLLRDWRHVLTVWFVCDEWTYLQTFSKYEDRKTVLCIWKVSNRLYFLIDAYNT